MVHSQETSILFTKYIKKYINGKSRNIFFLYESQHKTYLFLMQWQLKYTLNLYFEYCTIVEVIINKINNTKVIQKLINLSTIFRQ